MSLKKYITESERATAFPVTGDVLQVVVNEYTDNEIAIDFPVVEHTDDSITLHLDEYAYGILEDCNYVGDKTDGKIDPPSDLKEDRDSDFVVLYNGTRVADDEDSVYDLLQDNGYDIDRDSGLIMFHDKQVGDDLSHALDILRDNNYDIVMNTDESATTTKGYNITTNEGTLLERIKDGKIYCPEACCGVKVMDCTCGAKCPHCNCKQIQKLTGEIKMFEEQASLYKRLGVPSSAEYYTRKLTETKAQVDKLVEDVEEVEAMITRRIMNHPEFSDMVREYGIEQITQAIADTAEFHGDDGDEIGSSDISAMVNDTIKSLKRVVEAEYQGRKVQLNKPMQGDVKKFKVYVKDPKTGNVKKVNFGHGGTSAKGKTMKIRKNNPKARKSFRARHNCDNPGPKTKARYWSCRKW